MNNELNQTEEVELNQKRSDVHRPSVLVPSDYEFVGFEFIKIGYLSGDIMGDCEFLRAERETIRRHMTKTSGTYSRHQHGGNCHICGASAIYTVLFYHALSNVYVRTGQDCAQKLEMSVDGDWNAFRTAMKAVQELHAGKRKAMDTLDREGLLAAWFIYISVYGTKNEITKSWSELPEEETIVVDIVGKLVQYGSVSERTMKFLVSLVDKISRRVELLAERKAKHEAAEALPLVAGRTTIIGTVLSVKTKSTPYGDTLKMLVEHDTGWKVYGSVPKGLNTKRGDRIEFDAVVTISKDDNKFGFFSRPTKASLLMASAVALMVAA
jgi:hypothetical protein